MAAFAPIAAARLSNHCVPLRLVSRRAVGGAMKSPELDVFVSYKSEDRARLKPLVAALEAEGFTVWWDAHIGTGADWRDEIQQHLDTARCVIVAWSQRSVGPEGQFVCDEAGRAKKAGSYVPIKIDEVDPPLGFGGVQALSFVGWKGKRSDPRFVALVAAVHKHLTGTAPVVPRSVAYETKISRRTAIAGGVGAVAIAGTGGWLLLKPSAANANRIAVLSFANMSGDPAQAYFSDGIAEELRGALSRVGMQVIGKASCDAVKDLDLPAAAAKLGVAHILTGSVRRSPETIRIGAQLVNGSDGVEKWAQNYDRAPGDTIKIQTDIAAQVAGALSIALGAVKKVALTLGGTADAKAQDLYLEAQALAKSADSAEAGRKLIALYDEAIGRDLNYGDAHLGKASALSAYGNLFSNSPAETKEWLSRAEQSARRAAALMPNSGRPTAMLSAISASRLQFKLALKGFNQALSAYPNDTFVLRRALNFLPNLVEGSSALALADRYVALDPLNPTVYAQRGLCLFVLRRFEEAIGASTRSLALAPLRANPKYRLIESLILLNRPDEARAVLAKLPTDDYFGQTDEAIIAARRGDHTGAETWMAKIRTASGDSSSYQYAQINAQLGNTDGAFAALNKGVEALDPGMIGLKRDPFLDPIRKDPRYLALLTRLDFP